MPATRDPVSVLFDTPAGRLLTRAYARPGEWVGTRVADPGLRHLAWAAGLGIDLNGPDNAATMSGRHQDARSRWCRAFVHAVYDRHKWHYYANVGRLGERRRLTPNDARSVQFEVGRRVPVLGVLPAGRAVRIRVQAGGGRAMAAVRRLPESARIWDDQGNPAGRFSDVSGRDWA